MFITILIDGRMFCFSGELVAGPPSVEYVEHYRAVELKQRADEDIDHDDERGFYDEIPVSQEDFVYVRNVVSDLFLLAYTNEYGSPYGWPNV